MGLDGRCSSWPTNLSGGCLGVGENLFKVGICTSTGCYNLLRVLDVKIWY